MAVRKINIFGFALGENLNVSVSQNAVTAGPLNVSSWGGGTPAGNISINAERTTMRVAPDSVRFSVDLSEAGFDTQGPTGAEVYDARMHDLIYLWDFDDAASADWIAPENVLPVWKNRNTAKGPWVAHMYTSAGTYNPSVLVIEPSSGKTATASVEITVSDQDAVYPGPNTICVNQVGDDDFSEAPVGATRVNADEIIYRGGGGRQDQIWINGSGGNAKRWLFKRGGTFTTNIWIGGSYTNGLMFGAYGTGAKPILKSTGDGANSLNENPCIFNANYGGDIYNQGGIPDLRIADINFVGTFDPTTSRATLNWYQGLTMNAYTTKWKCDLMISGCAFSGWASPTIAFQPQQTEEAHFHIDDSSITDFGGQYALFGGSARHANSSWACTGLRMSQNPNAIDDDSYRAPIRTEHYTLNHYRGCDLFHTDSSQANIKVVNTPGFDGTITNIHSCAFEGGNQAVIVNANTVVGVLGRSSVQNCVIDGTIFVGNHGIEEGFLLAGTGCTIRNNLVIVPATEKINYANAFRRFVQIKKVGTVDADIVGAAPVKIYNNTVRVDRSLPENGGSVIPEMITDFSSGQFSGIAEEHNILHMPNFGTRSITAQAPLSETSLWSPRTRGWKPSVARYPGDYLGSDVPNGGTFFQPYWDFQGGAPLTRAQIDESSGVNRVFVSGIGFIALSSGQVALDFDASGVTVTNKTGRTWKDTWSYTIILDLMPNPPLQTGFALSASDVKDTRPLPGSAALGAALNGDVSYMDITLQNRPEPPSIGAWEAE